ncbi:MAG TPA: hypothetical protein VJR89_37380 [Polyangiales bacterium]|nr:hypothetical protein [Polyangiales bacterium]
MSTKIALLCCLISGLPSALCAQSRIQGFAPDAQVQGGIGAAARGTIENYFLGRLRIGALYADEPYWYSAGLTLEAGALPGLAIGGEIEWNQFSGWFAAAGLSYARDDRLIGHVGFGYTIVGVEWQHDFERARPNEGLLVTIRFPLGFWWFTSNRRETPPPTAAKVPRPVATSSAPQPSAAPARSPAQPALDEAAFAQARGDRAALADALRRAYAAAPDVMLWLRIADADLAQGKLALALEDLQHFLAGATSGAALAERPAVEARVAELSARVGRVRLALAAASGTEQVELDGAPQPSALLGYDLVVDPGPHQLRILRDGAPILERSFEAAPGELVRIELSLPPAAAR